MGPCSTLNHGITVGSHGHMGYSVFVHFGGSGSDLSHLSDRLHPRVLPSVPSHIAVVLSSPTCSQLAHAREVIPYRLRHTLKSTPLSAEQRANHSGLFNSPKLWISPPQFSRTRFGFWSTCLRCSHGAVSKPRAGEVAASPSELPFCDDCISPSDPRFWLRARVREQPQAF